jgi:putative addiction module component (TIGR02574 family)
VVNDLLTPPLVERLELVQTLWDSIAAEQSGPELTEADRQPLQQRLESFRAEAEHGIDTNDALGPNEKLV